MSSMHRNAEPPPKANLLSHLDLACLPCLSKAILLVYASMYIKSDGQDQRADTWQIFHALLPICPTKH